MGVNPKCVKVTLLNLASGGPPDGERCGAGHGGHPHPGRRQPGHPSAPGLNIPPAALRCAALVAPTVQFVLPVRV